MVAKLDALGNPLYTTCLGGTEYDAGYAIAVLNGEAYVTGESWSPDFPPPPGQPSNAGDILVAKFLANGTADPGRLKLIGGANSDQGSGIAVDGSGKIYIAGTTNSSSVDGSFNFPTTVGAAPPGGGLSDAVVLKLSSTLAIDFATYLGGDAEDYGYAIAVDTVQAFYVAGTTTSTDFPVTAAPTNRPNGGTDVFVARLHLGSSAPNKVTYGTYLGTADEDGVYGVATDTGGHAFVAGEAVTAGGATTSRDAFVAKLLVSRPPIAPVVTIAASSPNAVLSWSRYRPTCWVTQFRSASTRSSAAARPTSSLATGAARCRWPSPPFLPVPRRRAVAGERLLLFSQGCQRSAGGERELQPGGEVHLPTCARKQLT